MKREYLNRLGLPERYILYVGGYNKRKNIPLLLNAYSALGMKRKNVKLVLAGAAGNYGIASHVASLGLQNDVVRLTHIAEEDLSLLYSGAFFFVYPSLYEGFGLPVLEAMTCGTPVLSSNAGSLVEVAGDAALYFTPGNEDELTMLMERVLEDSILRDDMRSRGLNRANLYSWRRCAQETLTVYENILSR
jgi:glycosyltransferase involved in cell wall biosynthesis